MSYTNSLFKVEKLVIQREWEKEALLKQINKKTKFTKLELFIYKENYNNALKGLEENENIANLCLKFNKSTKTIKRILKSIEIKLILIEYYNINAWNKYLLWYNTKYMFG